MKKLVWVKPHHAIVKKAILKGNVGRILGSRKEKHHAHFYGNCSFWVYL